MVLTFTGVIAHQVIFFDNSIRYLYICNLISLYTW